MSNLRRADAGESRCSVNEPLLMSHDSWYAPLLMLLLWAVTLASPVFRASADVVFTNLHSFGVTDGLTPCGLVQGTDGYFYGVTYSGGPYATAQFPPNPGFGLVFKISPDGDFRVLHSFNGTDGAGPGSTWPCPGVVLVQGNDGYFYGTTSGGGTNSSGTFFRITTNGTFTSLYSFPTNVPGPNGPMQGSDGYFYGVCGGGIYKISKNGVFVHLYSLANWPNPQLVQGSNGCFYGTTQYGGENGGTVFIIYTTSIPADFYYFTGGNDGRFPVAGLVEGRDGYFYGTAYGGGANGFGTVFKISTNEAFTTLHSFAITNDGAGPNGLILGSDGNFYGTTYYGPPNGHQGTVFRITPDGVFTTLHYFSGTDGAVPDGLVQGRDGRLYGTTSGLGAGIAGTVFRLDIGLPPAVAAPTFRTVMLTNGALNLIWSTDVGALYQLQYNSDLSSSDWINLGSAVSAIGTTLSTTDALTNVTRRFYRVVRLP